MSIVEKAIQKHRRGVQSAVAVNQRFGTAGQSAEHEEPMEGSEQREASVATTPELPKIKIDEKRLGQYGLVPPEDYAVRLANEYRQVKRTLIDNIMESPDTDLSEGTTRRRQPLSRIIITSAVPGEGKSFTAVNLALSLAHERDYNVVLVDGDVLKPRVTHALGLVEKPGFGDLLADESMPLENAVFETDLPRLWIMPAGRRDPLLAEHLGSRRADQLLVHLARMRPAQLIVLDSPPLLATAEAPVLAARAGQVVLVVQAKLTAQHTLHAAMGRLREDHVVSLLLNQAELPKWDDYYGQYSGYYGAAS